MKSETLLIELLRVKDELVKDELKRYKEFIAKARAESKLCAIDGQHFVLVPYWFMMDIVDNSNGY